MSDEFSLWEHQRAEQRHIETQRTHDEEGSSPSIIRDQILKEWTENNDAQSHSSLRQRERHSMLLVEEFGHSHDPTGVVQAAPERY